MRSRGTSPSRRRTVSSSRVFFRDERKELFRARAPAQRPEAFAASAREDERINRIACHWRNSGICRDHAVARFPVSFFQNEKYKGMRCHFRYPFQKPAERLPLDGLLTLTRTALVLELECSWRNDSIAGSTGHGDRACFGRRARGGSVAGEDGDGTNQSAGIRARQPTSTALDSGRFGLPIRARHLLGFSGLDRSKAGLSTRSRFAQRCQLFSGRARPPYSSRA